MLTTILLMWIGARLNAPVAYYVLCSILLVADFIRFGIKMYQIGSRN